MHVSLSVYVLDQHKDMQPYILKSFTKHTCLFLGLLLYRVTKDLKHGTKMYSYKALQNP